MAKKDYKPSMKHDTENDPTKNDPLDDMLNVALAKYAAVEPRTGLEDRIIANLRTERVRVPSPVWWRWNAVAIAAAIVVTVTFSWRAGKPASKLSPPAIASHPEIASPKEDVPATQLATNNVTRPSPRGTNVHRHHQNALVAPPKLDAFPSPQPLSEQEIILANYVAHFHRQAVLIARVTNEELKRDRIEVLGNSESPDEVANQQMDQQLRTDRR